MTENLAMVTGASSGIGEAFARELAKQGFGLILVARRMGRLAALQAELGKAGIDSLCADLGSEPGIDLVSRRLERGDVSLLVNNAGMGFRGQVVDEAEANISQLVRVNLDAPMRLSRAALRPMILKKHGALVNVVSMSAFQPVPHLSVYAATKAGLLSFTEALSEEVRGSGVVIQALCPGNIPTEFQGVAGTAGSRFDRTPQMSAQAVARSSLRALSAKGATLHLPALADRAALFAQRFLPRFVARRVAGRLFEPE